MSGSASVVDFFALEASEYLERLDGLLADAGGRRPDPEPFVRNARALRGAATMARHGALAELASALEAVSLGLRDGSLSWTATASDAVTAAVDGYRLLLRQVREWTDGHAATAVARAAELRDLVAASASPARSNTIIPIARLFHDDAGPHVVERNPQPPISADLRFRQAAVPLASTLRRLIEEARHATEPGSRSAAGQDLAAAIRDLGELAESYDIRAVVNFARARETALAQLEERALDVVDGAAQALIESAGTAWARPTPPVATGVIEPPTTAAPPAAPRPQPAVAAPATPAATSEPAAPTRTPPSGQALVALLETSISGLNEFAATDPAERSRHAAAHLSSPAGGLVAIETLVYRGRAALDRAREVRDLLRGATPPDPALLSELFDLLDLAALDEPAPA
jgi:chemotaxis protein histidine kinase CheA